jgi:hypothetical protein
MHKPSVQYDCCHEAGHAVIARIHGYKIRKIKLRGESEFPRNHIENGSMVEYERQPWTCSICGSCIDDRSNARLLAGLKKDCSGCGAETIRFIERCSGGAAATLVLLPSKHDWAESGCDIEQIRSLYPGDVITQNSVIQTGLEAACRIVEENKSAVRKLCDVFMKSELDMSGCEVEQTVDHLLRSEI